MWIRIKIVDNSEERATPVAALMRIKIKIIKAAYCATSHVLHFVANRSDIDILETNVTVSHTVPHYSRIPRSLRELRSNISASMGATTSTMATTETISESSESGTSSQIDSQQADPAPSPEQTQQSPPVRSIHLRHNWSPNSTSVFTTNLVNSSTKSFQLFIESPPRSQSG